MALPISIEDLLNKCKVESNRIEFKKGWNPVDIYRTICAFANDIENIGGGYIVVGVEEENGVAKRPVTGVPVESLDRIQREIHQYNQLIEPMYAPRLSVEEVDGVSVLVIWATSGHNRPYTVPADVNAKLKKPTFYVRYGTSSIEAKGEILDELRELANRVPFDERGNEAIKTDDISGVLVYDYLKTIGSKLAENFTSRPLEETLDEMDLRTGPTENRLIKNCAAMMFCNHPETFFPVTQVDIVLFPEGSIENPDMMIEAPKIAGPVPQIIKETLSYLRTNVIKKKITKPTDKEESDKIFNYPYQALEEAVVNALYHRDYQEREPIEITIEPTHIDILSYAGPDRSISAEAIKAAKKLKARRYRNRRLGDFLKELDLTEGRATGIPTIQKALRDNGSEAATIETDENRTYFLLTIPCRKGFEGKMLTEEEEETKTLACVELEQRLEQMFVQVHSIINQSFVKDKAQLGQILEQMFVQVWSKAKSEIDILKMVSATVDVLSLLQDKSLSANAINHTLGFGETYELKRKILYPLLEQDYIAMTNPDKPTSAKQAYKLTEKALNLF